MTVEQHDVVDIISKDPGCGRVTLTISDHLPWNDAHLALLNKKLANYHKFIERGGLKAEYGVDPASVKICISVLLKYRPTEQALEFLKAAENVSRAHGYAFEFIPIPDLGYCDDAS